MSRTINPRFCVFTLVTQHQFALPSLLLIKIGNRSLLDVAILLKLHNGVSCCLEVVCVYGVAVGYFSLAVARARRLTEKFCFERNEAGVAWNVSAIVHLILF
jgi:hypothetical protein